MLLDIVILPPAKLRNKIGRQIKVAAKGYKRIFVVDNQKLIPHLSLFHIRTSKDRIKNLEFRIKKILMNHSAIKIRKVGVNVYGGGTVSFELSNNKNLTQMHKNIVESCYSLKIGTMPWTELSKLTEDIRDYRKKYGTQHIFKFFHPHFTLGLFKSGHDAKMVAKKLKKIKFKFMADTVAITEVNFWHQVTRIIKKFKLRD